jgi:hypothetical protein
MQETRGMHGARLEKHKGQERPFSRPALDALLYPERSD